MRTIAIIIVSLLVSAPFVMGQPVSKSYTKKSDCAAVTQRAINQGFTYAQQLELFSNPDQLAAMDYMYAYSYEFAPGQMVLRSHRELINVDTYKHLRHSTRRIEVYDEKTQMVIILYSWTEVELALRKVRISTELASCN